MQTKEPLELLYNKEEMDMMETLDVLTSDSDEAALDELLDAMSDLED